MDKIKIKQEVFGLGGSEEPKDFCAKGEEEAIGEKEEHEKEKD